jgi:hypothetical protein
MRLTCIAYLAITCTGGTISSDTMVTGMRGCILVSYVWGVARR